MSFRSSTLCLLLAVIAGCDAESSAPAEVPDAPPDGEVLFMQPHADGNTFACNSCHALREPTADFRRPGHPLADAANRPTFKNGALPTLLDAVNTCRTEWMVAPAFAEDDPRWQRLEGFLQAAAGDAPADPLAFEVVPPPADVTGGDVEAGRETFNTSCAVCHGADATGTERAPLLVGAFLSDAYIAERIRTSGASDSPTYDGLTGGRMPFWAADRFSDDELRDVVAFLLQNDPRDIAPMPEPEPEPDGLRECDATHPLVGSTATFQTFSHQVAGMATVVDDCTIRLDDFTFDGLGVDVQIYGGLGGAYENGFSMSEDIRRSPAYDGESLTFQLPPDRSLDDLDGVSVWCVPIGINFGDARFE